MSFSADQRRRHYRIRMVVGAIFLLVAGIPVLMQSAASLASMRNLPAEWLPDSEPLKSDFMEFIRQFSVTDLVFLSWPDAKLDDPSMDRVMQLLRPLSAEHQADVQARSEQNRSRFLGDTDFHREIRELCQHPAPLDWIRAAPDLIEQLQQPPIQLSERAARNRLRGSLVGPDGRQCCVVLSLGSSTSSHHRDMLPRMRAAIARSIDVPIESVSFVGGPVDGAAIDQEAMRSIERFSVPASLLAALLCWWCLRVLPITIAVVSVALFGQGLVLALVHVLGSEMNAVLIILPPLVFVLTVSAGIHLSHYYLATVEKNPLQHPADAARHAMQMGTLPCVLATVTTVIGMMSLTLVRLEPVRMFGWISSLGILTTLGLLILVLPGAMVSSALPRSRWLTRRSEKKDGLDPFTSIPLSSKFVFLRHPWVVMGAYLLVAIGCAVGLGRLNTSVSVPDMFPVDSDLRKQYRWFEAQVGATATGDLMLKYPRTEDADPLVRLKDVQRVHAKVLGIDGVGGVLSIASYLPSVSSRRGLSASVTRSVTRGLLEDPESEVRQLGYLYQDEASETWRISLRLFQAQDADFESRIDSILNVARKTLLEPTDTGLAEGGPTKPTSIGRGATSISRVEDVPELSITGHVVIVQRSQRILLNDLFKSFIAAFGVIAVVMIFVLRSLIGGLLAMVPNIFPSALLFGVMGWLEVPLDIGSVMTASVALGIAVDDSVHLLSRFSACKRRGQDDRQASGNALRECGMAMLHTTLVCGLSLMAYVLSEFVPTQRFAWFMFGLLAAALVSVSTLLPAIMASRLGQFLSRGIS